MKETNEFNFILVSITSQSRQQWWTKQNSENGKFWGTCSISNCQRFSSTLVKATKGRRANTFQVSFLFVVRLSESKISLPVKLKTIHHFLSIKHLRYVNSILDGGNSTFGDK